MITVILPDTKPFLIAERSKRIGELERTIQFYQQDRSAKLRERNKFIELFQDWKDTDDLPKEHPVSKILKEEFEGDV